MTGDTREMQQIPNTLGAWLITALGVLVAGALIRIGWEVGGRLWGAL